MIERVFVNRRADFVTLDQTDSTRLRERALPSPPTHYAHSGDASIAYQVYGSGSLDLVVINGPASHLELMWEESATRSRATGARGRCCRSGRPARSATARSPSGGGGCSGPRSPPEWPGS